MSGERDPYKGARLGVIEQGAWADLLIIDGDPTKDINVLREYEQKFLVIMKDGKLHKNTIH